MKRTKTWNIGEYAIGGKIKVVFEPKKLLMIKAICNKSGEVIDQCLIRWPLDSFNLEAYLCNLTSSYYASKIIDWVRGVEK